MRQSEGEEEYCSQLYNLSQAAPSRVSWRDLPHVFLILGPRLVMALITAMITAAGKREHDELHMASQSLH